MMSLNHGNDCARQPGEPAADTLDGIWGIYYRRGYEDGHREAIRDVLGSLMVLSEEFLGRDAGTTDPRQLVYAFERHIENGLEEIACRAVPGVGPPPPVEMNDLSFGLLVINDSSTSVDKLVRREDFAVPLRGRES